MEFCVVIIFSYLFFLQVSSIVETVPTEECMLPWVLRQLHSHLRMTGQLCGNVGNDHLHDCAASETIDRDTIYRGTIIPLDTLSTAFQPKGYMFLVLSAGYAKLSS